jgi:hypothetical protein
MVQVLGPRIVVAVWSGAFIAENVLPVVGAEGSNVFPLRVANFVTMPDRTPSAHPQLFVPPLLSSPDRTINVFPQLHFQSQRARFEAL